MTRFSFFLAVAFAMALPLQAAYAQIVVGINFCFTENQFGFRVSGTMYPSSNVANGTGLTGAPFQWSATATRGTTSDEIRHHSFTLMNPNIGGLPDCTSGQAGYVDWITFNGRITGGNSSSGYTWSGDVRNSCGFEDPRTGLITLGFCPPSRIPAPAFGSGELAPSETSSSEVSPSGTSPAAQGEATPEAFSLTSAPNPFASGTVITYALPEAEHVRLAVYDVLGREVAVLVDGQMEAGTHYVDFDGAALPAGTYLYRIEAGNYAEAKQMVLVR